MTSTILPNVDRIILVLSGKGGVGKSTVAVQLALSLAAEQKRVGILDIDLCGPSIPLMLGLENAEVVQSQEGWLPVQTVSPVMSVMSIGFLLRGRDSAVIWRGPKKNAMIKQFLTDVNWGHLDYLIIDTPPGTSDEHISVVETLKLARNPDGAVLVSTPQGMSLGDVRREIGFCRKAEIPIFGLIENMSGYVCPHCSDCTNIFSKGGGQSLAQLTNIPFLGAIPIDPKLGECAETGQNFVAAFSESEAAKRFKSIARSLLEDVQ
ncbi:Cytosolic Fe-S cluster assembly factor NUBP2 -like protein [Halotydeus destructor]|nr:Cytosolic Fe-S cluster assembly factor NUBP2 -like protein [Halotydeus destructor]